MQLLENVPNNDPMFCPNICGHYYKGKYRKRNLKRHMIYSCRVDPQFQCTICLKKFRSNQVLKFHLANIHDMVIK